MTNPLTDRAQALSIPSGPVRDLTEWCADQNALPLTARMDRWYFVNTDKEGRRFIDKLDGVDGDAARKLIAGKLDDFYGWSEQRMAGYRRWLWSCIQRGKVSA